MQIIRFLDSGDRRISKEKLLINIQLPFKQKPE